MVRRVLVAVLAALWAGAAVAQNVPAALNDQTLEEWVRALAPSEEECAFEGIPWRLSFPEGVREAQRLEKPILLWAMNGHPMGCT